MDENVYTYHKIPASADFEDDTIINLGRLSFLDNAIFEEESFNYTQFSLPQNIFRLLTELLEGYELSEHLPDFTKVLAISQKLYNQKAEHLEKSDQLSQNFLDLTKDLSELFEILKQYLFSDNKSYLQSINFKNKTKKYSIGNFFVVSDIYSSIVEYYGFTKENFEERKTKLLDAEDISHLIDDSELFKTKLIRYLFSMLLDKEFKKSEILRFIGVFLHLSQIQSNNKQELLIFSTLSENFEYTDLKNLNHYVSRKNI